MCIRDRLNASRTTGTITLEDILVEDDPVLPILTLRITDKRVITMPVSYTHLRAHETVLDLVCRLLLEKKKNSPS